MEGAVPSTAAAPLRGTFHGGGATARYLPQTPASWLWKGLPWKAAGAWRCLKKSGRARGAIVSISMEGDRGVALPKQSHYQGRRRWPAATALASVVDRSVGRAGWISMEGRRGVALPKKRNDGAGQNDGW